jgi:hypothetical protein
VKFDRFSEDDFASSVIPDGENEMAITKIKTVVSKKSGAEFLVLTFRDTNDSYNEVEKWLNPDEKRDQKAAMNLNESLGRPWDADLDDILIGQVLVVKTQRAVKDGNPVLDQDGNQRVYVNGFLPSSAPVAVQAAKAPPKRTSTQKADAASGASSDDIPF